MPPRTAPVAMARAGWVTLEQVLVALQGSLERADALMEAEAEAMQFVVAEFTMTFPAELSTDRGRRTLLRLPSDVRKSDPPIDEHRLSRVTLTVRPAPKLERTVQG